MEFSLFPWHYGPDCPTENVLFLGDLLTEDCVLSKVLINARYTKGNIGICFYSKEREPIGGIVQQSYYPEMFKLEELENPNRRIDDIVSDVFKRTNGESDIFEIRGEITAYRLLKDDIRITAEFSNVLLGYGKEIFYKINAETDDDKSIHQLKVEVYRNQQDYDPALEIRRKEYLLSRALNTKATH